MKSFVLFVLLFSQLASAQLETERMVSVSAPVKGQKEAKPLLVHSAVLAAISQFSKELNLDASEFEKQLKQKFEQYFIGYKERKITEKFGKNYSANLSEEQKRAFFAEIEAQKENLFIKNSKLHRLLDSYAFKNIENDPSNDNLWKAIIVLSLNQGKVQKYFERLTSKEEKQYSSIRILAEINRIGFDWSELGVESSSSFTDALLDSWFKWLTTNQPSNVEDIRLCNKGSCPENFIKWQQISQEEGMSVPENILNGLWLKVSFNLRKKAFKSTLNEWQFEWDGSVVLLDVNTKKTIASYILKPESKTFRQENQQSLNSALASAMYRSALDSLSHMVREVQNTPRLNGLNRLVIRGHHNLGDVLSLMNLLREEGKKLNFEVLLDVFTRNEAQLLCFYQGEEKSFTDLLSRVKELKSSHSYSLVNEFSGVHHVLKLVAQ